MRRRDPRLTVLAAFLAAILAFVAVGHAGSHVGSTPDSGIACGVCADPGVEADHAGEVASVLLPMADVSLQPAEGVSRPADAAHAPRGPPALLA